MIFLLIAGTYTPFALLVLKGSTATAILVAVWAGALAGIVFKLVGSTRRSGWARARTSRWAGSRSPRSPNCWSTRA